jgi:Holliday junction resolvasome RuvABC endonuclease subunit
MRIMGLDASTTTIGISILDYDLDGYNNIKLVYASYYKPDKSIGVLDMLVKARKHILDLAVEYSVDEFAIEQYIQFMKGKSSASTVIPLAIINTTIQLSILDFFNKETKILNVLTIRHALKFGKELPKKEDMPDLVAKHLGIEYPWIYKYNKKKKENVIAIESEDVADAIAVSLAYLKVKSRPVKVPKTKVKKKKVAKK